MLTQWVVVVLNCNVLCHLQQCKCPDQDLWAPLYIGWILVPYASMGPRAAHNATTNSMSTVYQLANKLANRSDMMLEGPTTPAVGLEEESFTA